MLHRPSSPVMHNRLRSKPHPVPPQRVGRLFGTNENAPVRPPRNPARPVTSGEAQLTSPSPWSNPTRPSEDVGNHREERHKPSVNPPPKPLDNRKLSSEATPRPQINTLDRKILQELKQSMLARSAQFALKNKTKHHPFSPEEVPYPRSYDHKCIDTDVWETVFCEQFCRNVTFHTFEVPPTKVLDLGCGSGAWIMSCAMRWKECHFVGLDIVPLHPDLGRSELSQRVNWVQANFLEPLPFPNEEFDFVHVKRIARGVPENKWDAFFEEILRVMKPGAALEMLEEDLYIPGQTVDSVDNCPSLSAVSSSGSSEEHSQSPVSSVPGPSTSLPDIFAGQGPSSSQMIRRSTSERAKNQPPVTQSPSDTLPPPLPVCPTPDYSRAFPRPRRQKTSNTTLLPISTHFNLNNLFPKRSGRDDGTGTDVEQPRKNKETVSPVSSRAVLYPVPVSSSSAAPVQKPKKTYRATSGGRSAPWKPYRNMTVTSSKPIPGPKKNINTLPMPVPQPHGLGARDRSLTLPQVESTNGELGVDFPRSGQDEESLQARTRSLSCPTPEDDGQRKYSANREFESFDPSTISMHDYVQQRRSSHPRNPRNSGEPVESIRWDKNFTAGPLPPPPPPRNIPGRPRPQAMFFSLSPDDVYGSTTRLSRSVPDEATDQSLSPALEATAPKQLKSLSTSSLEIRPRNTTAQVHPLLRNNRSAVNFGAGNIPIIRPPSPEIPTNPRRHKLLELIYSEMHMARFVNLAPLSLLENYIRAYFKNVHTHAPLIFAFPPPPGCDHRPEFDAAELQQRELERIWQIEYDNQDQDRYLEPDLEPDLILAFPPPPGRGYRAEFHAAELLQGKPNRTREVEYDGGQDRYFGHPARERSSSVTTNQSGLPRARFLGSEGSHPSIADSETANYRQLRSRGSKVSVRPRDGLSTGTSQYGMTDTSMAEGFPPARAAKVANESASSTGDEREYSRQRSNSLFTRSNDAKGKGPEGGEGRKRSLVLSHKPSQLSTRGSSPPPSLFGYENTATSSTSLSLSVASSSSSATIQHDLGKGKQRMTVAESAQLSAFSNNMTEIDVKSLSLHLRVRVVEILGCSEAMWEWVKEFQHRENEKERRHQEQLAAAAKARPMQGVGGGRVAYYHHDHARRKGGRRGTGSEGSDHPALRHKTSTKTFSTGTSGKKSGSDGHSLDGDGQGTSMKSPGCVADSPTSYYSPTSSGSVRGDDPSERMEKNIRLELLRMTRDRFDEVLSWFQFDMDDSIRLTRSMATRTPSELFATEQTEQRKLFDAACQRHETYLQRYPKQPTSPVKPNSISSRSPPNSQHYQEELCCMPPLLDLVHPSRRLCRTIRVWVAWKP